MRKTAIWWGTVLAAVLMLGTVLWWLRPLQPQEEHAIFQGVFYSAQELPETPESRGLAHLVRIDLQAPGVQLYNTPLDPEAVAAGDQYRLSYTWWEGRRRGLAVAINGTLFPWAFGVVSTGGVGAGRTYDYLQKRGQPPERLHVHDLGRWQRSAAHYREAPPPDQVLENAVWGVGGCWRAARQSKNRSRSTGRPSAPSLAQMRTRRNCGSLCLRTCRMPPPGRCSSRRERRRPWTWTGGCPPRCTSLAQPPPRAPAPSSAAGAPLPHTLACLPSRWSEGLCTDSVARMTARRSSQPPPPNPRHPEPREEPALDADRGISQRPASNRLDSNRHCQPPRDTSLAGAPSA